MSSITHNKDDRINIRLKQDAKQMLERAASFEGKTVSKFILSSALNYAEKTIKKHEVMNLNSSDSETFFTALATPIQFNKKLISAFAQHDQDVISK